MCEAGGRAKPAGECCVTQEKNEETFSEQRLMENQPVWKHFNEKWYREIDKESHDVGRL